MLLVVLFRDVNGKRTSSDVGSSLWRLCHSDCLSTHGSHFTVQDQQHQQQDKSALIDRVVPWSTLRYIQVNHLCHQLDSQAISSHGFNSSKKQENWRKRMCNCHHDKTECICRNGASMVYYLYPKQAWSLHKRVEWAKSPCPPQLVLTIVWS